MSSKKEEEKHHLWIGPCLSGARVSDPPKRQRNKWQKIPITHLECIEDFAGNNSNSGFWADLWEGPRKERYVLFGGFWEHYAWARGPRTRPSIHQLPYAVSLHKHPTFLKRGNTSPSFDFSRFWPKNTVKAVVLPPKDYLRYFLDRERAGNSRAVKAGTIGHPSALWKPLTMEELRSINAAASKGPGDQIDVITRRGTVSVLREYTRFTTEDVHHVSLDGKPWFTTTSYAMLLRLLQRILKPHEQRPTTGTGRTARRQQPRI